MEIWGSLAVDVASALVCIWMDHEPQTPKPLNPTWQASFDVLKKHVGMPEEN